jgi:hypothetical protein
MRIIGHMTIKARVNDDGLALTVIMQDKLDSADLVEASNISESEAILRFFRENEIPALVYEIPLNQPVKATVEKRVIRNNA